MLYVLHVYVFFFKQKTAYEMRISDWSSDVCSSDLFTGSSATLPDNFNAPLPVVRAAVLYVLRTMLDDPIPMNEGCLAPVTLIVPDDSMLSPRYPAAVVAGNVETSQVITDALFAAFGAMAPAQGTMNNLKIGRAHV